MSGYSKKYYAYQQATCCLDPSYVFFTVIVITEFMFLSDIRRLRIDFIITKLAIPSSFSVHLVCLFCLQKRARGEVCGTREEE